MCVDHVVFLNHAAMQRPMLPGFDPALNSFTIVPGTNPDLDISVTISATDVGTLFVWLSKTHTAPPAAA